MDTRRAPDELRAKIEARRQRRQADAPAIARHEREARQVTRQMAYRSRRNTWKLGRSPGNLPSNRG